MEVSNLFFQLGVSWGSNPKMGGHMALASIYCRSTLGCTFSERAVHSQSVFFQSSAKSCGLFLHCRCSCMTHTMTPTRLSPSTAIILCTSHLELDQVRCHSDAGNTEDVDQCVGPQSEVIMCCCVFSISNVIP